MSEAIKWRGKKGNEPHVSIELWLDESDGKRSLHIRRVSGKYKVMASKSRTEETYIGFGSDVNETFAIRKAIVDLETGSRKETHA